MFKYEVQKEKIELELINMEERMKKGGMDFTLVDAPQTSGGVSSE